VANVNPTKQVWKFPLQIEDGWLAVEMPRGAKLLTVMMQYDVMLWALVDPEQPSVQRRIKVFGTGHPILNADMLVYIGSVTDGPFVWHVFDGGER